MWKMPWNRESSGPCAATVVVPDQLNPKRCFVLELDLTEPPVANAALAIGPGGVMVRILRTYHNGRTHLVEVEPTGVWKGRDLEVPLGRPGTAAYPPHVA